MKLTILTVALSDDADLAKTISSVTEAIKHLKRLEIEYIVVCPHNIAKPAGVKNFHYVQDNGVGIFNAMNLGIKKSTGDYINFLNSGDIFAYPAVLKSVEPYLNASRLKELKIVTGSIQAYYNNHSVISDCRPWSAHQASFIPKKLFEHRCYNTELKVFGDLEFWYYLKSKGKFELERMPITVACFKYGGISNKPSNAITRSIERSNLAKLYGDKPYWFFRTIRALISRVVSLIFGDTAYYYCALKLRLW